MSQQQVEIDYILNLQFGDNLSYGDLRKIEMSMIRIGNIIQKVFPDSQAAKIMEDVQKIINLARTAQIALRAMQMAEGPVGWIFAGTTVVAAAFSASDFMMS
jgi:hypothetical protein